MRRRRKFALQLTTRECVMVKAWRVRSDSHRGQLPLPSLQCPLGSFSVPFMSVVRALSMTASAAVGRPETTGKHGGKHRDRRRRRPQDNRSQWAGSRLHAAVPVHCRPLCHTAPPTVDSCRRMSPPVAKCRRPCRLLSRSVAKCRATSPANRLEGLLSRNRSLSRGICLLTILK